MATLTLGKEQVEEEPAVDDGKVKIAKLWKPLHIKHGGWWVILELQATQPRASLHPNTNIFTRNMGVMYLQLGHGKRTEKDSP